MPARIAALLAAASLAACSSPAEVAEKTGVEPTASATASAGGAEATSNASAFAYAKNLSEAGGGTMDFAYAWPKQVAAEPELAALLRKQLDKDLADTRQGWEESYADCPQDAVSCRNYSLDSKYLVVADLPRFLSLSNETSVYTGGAHGSYGVESLVWDREAKTAMSGVEMFRSPAALGAALGKTLCDALNKERVKKGMEPIEGEDGVFDACPPLDDASVLVGSSNRKTFDRITVYYGPYVAGSYAEGAYELNFPMTAKMLEAVKPEYRAAFGVGR